MLLGLVADTPVRLATMAAPRSGPGATDQTRPFQCSISPPPAGWLPTAQPVPLTSSSCPGMELADCGARVQLVPSQCSMRVRVSVLPAPAGTYQPTAQAFVAEVAATASR